MVTLAVALAAVGGSMLGTGISHDSFFLALPGLVLVFMAFQIVREHD